jgi:hypothetical protein
MRSEEWRPAAAIHNRCPGRSGRPPPGTTTRMRGVRSDRSGANAGEGSAAPEPKIATVERREAGVPRMRTQGASLGAWPAPIVQAPRVPRKHPTTLGAPPTPSSG